VGFRLGSRLGSRQGSGQGQGRVLRSRRACRPVLSRSVPTAYSCGTRMACSTADTLVASAWQAAPGWPWLVYGWYGKHTSGQRGLKEPQGAPRMAAPTRHQLLTAAGPTGPQRRASRLAPCRTCGGATSTTTTPFSTSSAGACGCGHVLGEGGEELGGPARSEQC
jgi:hypothetical protein